MRSTPDPGAAASATPLYQRRTGGTTNFRRNSRDRNPGHRVQGHRRHSAERCTAGAVVSPAPGTMRSALRHGAFRRLVVGLAVSQAGDWLYNVALLAFVYERTHSAGWLA